MEGFACDRDKQMIKQAGLSHHRIMGPISSWIFRMKPRLFTGGLQAVSTSS